MSRLRGMEVRRYCRRLLGYGLPWVSYDAEEETRDDLPFGLRRRYQSFFCSLVEMLLLLLMMWLGNSDGDVHQGRGPFQAVHTGQLLQQNLGFLTIRCTLCNKVNTLTELLAF